MSREHCTVRIVEVWNDRYERWEPVLGSSQKLTRETAIMLKELLVEENKNSPIKRRYRIVDYVRDGE